MLRSSLSLTTGFNLTVIHHEKLLVIMRFGNQAFKIFQMIERARLERERAAGQFQMERKMKELIKIRLDSCELIRRSTILQKIRQKERIVAQKQLLKRQRRLKEINNQVYFFVFLASSYKVDFS